LKGSILQLDLNVDAGVGDAHEQSVTKMLRDGARAYIALAMKLQKTVPIIEESGM